MQYVGAVVGGVIGFYAGGVSGAIYGAQLGYGIGAVVQASNEKIVTEGPRLSDLKVTISSNGAFIPRVYVYTGGMGGNIIDATDLQPTTKDVEQQSSGGKGGPTQVSRQTTYSASFLVLLCKSLGTHDVQWIKANGNLFFSRHPDADALTLIGQQSLVGSVMVYDGNGDQLPDPTLEAIHGVGNVPAYRGRLTVMFKDFQLEKFSNNVASTQLTFGVVENPIEGGNEKPLLIAPNGGYAMLDEVGLWYVENYGTRVNSRATFGGMVYLDVLDGSGPQPQGVFSPPDASHPNLVSFDVPGSPCPGYKIETIHTDDFHGEAISTKDATVWRFSNAYHIEYNQIPYTDGHSSTIVGYCTGQTLVDDGNSHARFYSPKGVPVGDLVIGAGVQAFRTDYPQVDAFGTPQGSVKGGWVQSRNIAATDGQDFAWCETISLASVVHSWFTIIAGGFGHQETLPSQRIAGMLQSVGLTYLLLEGNYSSVTNDYRYDLRVIDVAGNRDTTTIGARWAYGAGRSIGIFLEGSRLDVVDSGVLRMSWTHLSWEGATFVPGDLTSNPAGGGHGAYGSETRTLKWQGPDFHVTSYQSGLAVGSPQENVYVYSNAVSGTPQPLRYTIQKLHDEVGLPNYDFSLLPDSVLNPGYCVTRQASARVAIDFLRDLFRVDTAESANKIKYVLRGRDALRTLTLDELGAVEGDISSGGAPQAIEWTLPDEYAQPRAVNLKYTAIDANFEVGTAIARRETTPSEEVVTLDVTAMMLTGDAAAKLAEQALVDHAISGETAKVATTYLHEDLETADPIIVPGKFKDRRVRITGKADKGGVVEWQLMRDEASSLEQFVSGGAATSKGTQSSIKVEPLSVADFLNLPSLRPQDDDAGGYIFVSSTAPARAKGATAYDQVPDAARTIGSVVGREGIKGITISVLGTFDGTGYDSGSFVDVKFPAGTELESTTPELMQSQGKNIFLFGNGEISGVITTTSLGDDVWRLHGGMLRGLRGTEAAIATHTVGEPVYWLTLSGLLRDKVAVAGPVSVAAVGIGRPMTDLKKFGRKATNTSQALVPFAPLYLTSGASGGEALRVFSWMRRSRKIQADPFNVPIDDVIANSLTGYQFQLSPTSDFATADTQYVQTEFYQLTKKGWYYAYLLGLTYSSLFARVAQVAADGRTPGAWSAPIQVNPVPDVVFPYGLLHLSTAGADGSTAFRDTTIYGNPDGNGITVTGAVHKSANRAVFAGGTDAIATYGGGLPVALSAANFAFQMPFKTSASAAQTLLYHGDAGFASGSFRIVMTAGVLSFWLGSFSNSQPLFTATGSFANGVEHVLELYALPSGYDPVAIAFINLWQMRVDGVLVGGKAHNNTDAPLQADYIMGNDLFASGQGFIGSLGDLRADAYLAGV